VRFRITPRRVTILAGVAVLLGSIPATAAMSSAATATGYVSFANWSPTASDVDVYIYPADGSSSQPIMGDLGYHGYTTYAAVNPGSYTVAIRPAGASSSSQPLMSSSLNVQANKAYSVADLPTQSGGGQLEVIPYNLTAPKGMFLLWVVNATSTLLTKFHCSCGPGAKGDVATDLEPGGVTPRAAPIPPGNWVMSVNSRSGAFSADKKYYQSNTVITEVVYQGSKGSPAILNVVDGVNGVPSANGGMSVGSAGSGGTAPNGLGSLLPWVALMAAGAVLVVAGSLRLRQGKRRQPATGV
jgi:Domain of unknown function (DUF4397)